MQESICACGCLWCRIFDRILSSYVPTCLLLSWRILQPACTIQFRTHQGALLLQHPSIYRPAFASEDAAALCSL